MEDFWMKIRSGLVLMMAFGLGMGGCASGGAPSTGFPEARTRSGGPAGVAGGEAVSQGYSPRNTENTRMAETFLENAGREDEAEAARPIYEQALAASALAIREDSLNPLAYRLAAMANLGVEDYEAAGANFDRAEELRPLYQFDFESIREEVWIDLYQSAIPSVNSGDYEGAAAIYVSANAIYTQRPEAMIMLSQIQAQLGQYDESVENIDAAFAILDSDIMLETDEETAASWREQAQPLPALRAQVLAAAGRYEEAIADYRTLLVDDPTNTQAKRDLATMLIQTGAEAEGFEVFEELLQDPALSGEDLYAIGVGFYQGSAYGRAATAFQMAGEKNRYDRDSIELWARSLQLDSAYADVPEAADRWIELDPSSVTAHLVLAQAVNAMEDAERTGDVVREMEALEVDVSNLSLTKYGDGGARITGQVTNRLLDAGTQVTLTFTFYSDQASPVGTLEQTVAVGEENMAEVFAGEFDSPQVVGGYSYQVSVN